MTSYTTQNELIEAAASFVRGQIVTEVKNYINHSSVVCIEKNVTVGSGGWIDLMDFYHFRND